MATRKCRMTDEEKRVHAEAVKLRKMTDEQLVARINNSGALKAHEILRTFGLWLRAQKGFGPKTMEKLDAQMEAYIADENGLKMAETLKRKKVAKRA